jgi:hypothetical protein
LVVIVVMALLLGGQSVREVVPEAPIKVLATASKMP